MDLNRLHEIIEATTRPLRKGHMVTEQNVGGIAVKEVYGYPHESTEPDLKKVDVEFFVVGVDAAAAEKRKAELVALLDVFDEANLKNGPSYMTVGGALGSQQAAFQLFALGEVLGLWSVITPATFGLTGPEAKEAAGKGYIMISGYSPKA